MRELVDRIRLEGRHVGGGIVKLDSFLNHQVDPELTRRIGEEFQRRFEAAGAGAVTRVVTAEASDCRGAERGDGFWRAIDLRP